MKKLIIFIFLFLILFTGFTTAERSLFFDGSLSFNINGEYNAGENISTTFNIYNQENFPLADVALIVEVVKGCPSPTYPSQDSDCDNIFYEKVIPNISISPNSERSVNFSYVLPKDLLPGTYRIDAFLRTTKTPIVGMAHILLPGVYNKFTVKGNGSFPFSQIVRTKTNIDGQTGPIGVGHTSTEEIKLNTVIFSNKSFDGKLKLELCEWQDVLCNPISIKEESVNILPGENNISTIINNPGKAGAYAIRIELFEKQRLISLYRSRVIIYGESARIRKLYPNKYYYDNENAQIFILISGTPDHYTNPTTKDIDVEVKIINNDNKNEMVKKFHINELVAGERVAKNISFKIKGELANFEVCAKISSKGYVYDKYCYNIKASNFKSDRHEIVFKKIIKNGILNGTICTENIYTKKQVKSNLFVLVTRNDKYIKQFSGVNKCLNISFDLEGKEGYVITIQDKTTDQEKIINSKNVSKGTTNQEKIINSKNVSKNTKIYIVLIIILIILFVVISAVIVKRKMKKI